MRDNGRFTPIEVDQNQVAQETEADVEHETRIKPGDVRKLEGLDEITSEEDQKLLFTDEYPYKWLELWPLVLVTSYDPETRSAEVVMVSGAYDGPWPRLLTDLDTMVGAAQRIDSRTEDPIPEAASDLIVHTDILYKIGQEDLSSGIYGAVSKDRVKYIIDMINGLSPIEPAWRSKPVIDDDDPRILFRKAQERIIEQVTLTSRTRVENELKSQLPNQDADTSS